MWTDSKIRESDVESRARGSDQIPSSTSSASGSWMLRTRYRRASGRTREHEYGEERTRFFSPSRGCSSCRSRCFCGTAGRRLGELPYPFSCMPSGPFLPHPTARVLLQGQARAHGDSPKTRRAGYRSAVLSPDIGSPPQARSGEDARWRLPSRPLHGSSGGGAHARGRPRAYWI